ncbi:MAG: deoxyribodipyrimidine photo-lyase, partial [Gammaproteobacteria bacterium]
MDERRVRDLNDAPADDAGAYVLYWMQCAQRAAFNPALEYAARQANERGEPLVVGFGLYEAYPDASERHFAFMLEGLAETALALNERRIKLVVRRGRPDEVALELARGASLVVCDRGYLRGERAWRQRVADAAGRRVVQVEGEVVVPVEVASDKAEFAARTLRPKLEEAWPEFMTGLTETRLEKSSLPLRVTGDVDARDCDGVLASLDVERSVGRVRRFHGGTRSARAQLRRFLAGAFDGYADARNDPSAPSASNLSPYLHFGQISPVEVARKAVAATNGSQRDQAAFLEELIVRRELAVNFVYFTESYDRFACLPRWAQDTLSAHADDERPARYTRNELERGETRDAYWNAAMREMRESGYMHNYMRMYWGKKVLEWCNTPGYAYSTLLYLNNKYFLDGRDASSFANVAWIFGLHDRPWQ